MWQRVQAVGTDAIAKANLVTTKAERNAALDAAGDEIKAALAEEFAERAGEVKAAIRSLTKKLVRKRIVEDGMRVDGRGTRTSGPSRPRSTSSRPPTARRSSSAARPRSST